MADNPMLEKLARSEKRRELRMSNLRSVYTYRNKSTLEVTDNLLLLPKATESAHAKYFEFQFSHFKPEELKRLSSFELVRVGVFDKKSLTLLPCPSKKVLDFEELYNNVAKLNEVNSND